MGALVFLLSVRSRASRGRLWAIMVIFGGTLLLMGFIGVVAVHALGVQRASLNIGLIDFTFRKTGTTFNVSPWLAVLLLPTVIKRLHDRGRSGWCLIAFALAQIFFLVLAELADGIAEGRVSASPSLSPTGEAVVAYLQTLAPLAVITVAVWCFVELACLSGTVGANRYGADPMLRKADGREGVTQQTSS